MAGKVLDLTLESGRLLPLIGQHVLQPRGFALAVSHGQNFVPHMGILALGMPDQRSGSSGLLGDSADADSQLSFLRQQQKILVFGLARFQAIQGGKGALNALEAELVGSDPQYAAKKEAFYAKVQQICREFPPAQWAQAARLAYPAIAAPEARKPAPGPFRPGQMRPPVAPATDDPMEAMNFGIASAT